MNRKQSHFLLPTRLCVDLLMVNLAWIFSYYFRFHSYFEISRGVPRFALYAKLLPFIMFIWLLNSIVTGSLSRYCQFKRFSREIFDLIPGSILTLMGLIVFTYFYEEYRYSRLTLVVYAVTLPLYLGFGRGLVRVFLLMKRKSQEPKAILLFARGVGIRKALHVARQLEWGDVKIRGVVLPGPSSKDSDIALCNELGLRVVDESEDWAGYFVENPTHTVIVALSHNHYGFIEDHLERISDQVADIQILPDFARFTRLTPGVQIVDGIPLISLHESPLSGYNLVIKRLFDVLGSVLALVILSPIMLLIAAFVRLSSRGPVFYRQERMSLDGTRFACLKFRSMPVDAETQSGAVWAKPGDERATPLGSFLRRTSLDELPQLINVLFGDMSLVGPRPERPFFVNQFRTQIPGYMLRHKVKTGITGWAQVNGWRGSTSLEKRIECDLFYIQNWTIWLDLKILLLTLDEILRGRNAY